MRKKMAGVDEFAVFNVQEQEFKCIPTMVNKLLELHANLVGEICKTTGGLKCSHLKLLGTKDNPPSTERKMGLNPADLNDGERQRCPDEFVEHAETNGPNCT